VPDDSKQNVFLKAHINVFFAVNNFVLGVLNWVFVSRYTFSAWRMPLILEQTQIFTEAVLAKAAQRSNCVDFYLSAEEIEANKVRAETMKAKFVKLKSIHRKTEYCFIFVFTIASIVALKHDKFCNYMFATLECALCILLVVAVMKTRLVL